MVTQKVAKDVLASERDLMREDLTVRHAELGSRKRWSKMPGEEPRSQEQIRGFNSGRRWIKKRPPEKMGERQDGLALSAFRRG